MEDHRDGGTGGGGGTILSTYKQLFYSFVMWEMCAIMYDITVQVFGENDSPWIERKLS